jgi:hypothetical protein
MLPGVTHALDDDMQDHYAADSITTATHSSPISTVRTPPDFPAAAGHAQHKHRFTKQLDGASAYFDLDEASVEAAVLAYHAGFGMGQDPFGLDASLFSI